MGVAEKLQLMENRTMGVTVMSQSHGAIVMHANENLHEFFSEFLALVS